MPRITLMDPKAATGVVGEVFGEITKTFGMVPNLFRAYANHPDLLRTNWEKHKAIMVDGELPRKTKESIALAISSANGCQYCIAAHSMALKRLEITNEEIEKIKRLEIHDGQEGAIVHFAFKAATDPHHVADQDLTRLRDLGFSDRQILEALGVMEIFSSYNRFLDALDVPLSR
jgi:uncharacterized peroxidase-related enzyme